MDQTTPNYYPFLMMFFALFQVILGVWSYMKTRTWWLAAATLVVPFLGLPICLFRLRQSVKDNQVGGAVTYLSVIVGIAFFLWKLPAEEIPWMVIFTMEFFAGLGLVNIVNVSVEMRIRENGR